jgi:hypothetical protein
MALNPTTRLPHAMLIDLDDTILSAYGRPRWHKVANEFAPKLAPSPPREVATAILAFARNFWSTGEPAGRLKLGEARRLSVKGGFAALTASGHAALSDDLAILHGDDDTAAGAKAENPAFPRRGSRVVPSWPGWRPRLLRALRQARRNSWATRSAPKCRPRTRAPSDGRSTSAPTCARTITSASGPRQAMTTT